MSTKEFVNKLTEFENNFENYLRNENELFHHSDVLISGLLYEDENVDFQQYVARTAKLAENIAAQIPDSLNYYFKAIASYLNKNHADYLENIEIYIENYLKSHESIGYNLADSIMDLWYIFSGKEKSDGYTMYFWNTYLLEKFRKILRKFCPNSAFELYMKYQLNAFRKPDEDKIKACLKKIVSADEHWMGAYWGLGDIYRNQSEWLLAIENYERVLKECGFLKIEMSNEGLYIHLAESYSKLKEYSKEAENYEKCLKMNPDCKDVYNKYGLCLSKLERYEEAISYFIKSINFGIDKFYPYRNYFDALLRLGFEEDALSFTDKYPEQFNTKKYQDQIENLRAKKYQNKTRNGSGKIEKESIKEIDLVKPINKTTEFDFEKSLRKTTESDFAGSIEVAKAKSGVALYQHQQDAMRQMNKIILNADNYAGLLVLPTGGGKTLTATYWLMQSVLDKGRKILWLAHRHELLNQAQRSFEKVCYSDITKNKPQYNWRIISGQHDKPYNIKPDDDIIVASKTSLKRGFKHLDENWLKENYENVFLIIDEAHHATAKEYRELIDLIKQRTRNFQMLGLTATPFRTLEEEQGQLKKVFPDDIIYKIDLRELINRGILSEPIFEAVPTKINMTELFLENNSEAALERISQKSFFDIESIGENIAKAIAENRQRNDAIVSQYISKKDIYKQTLVFTLNIDMAIALNALFKERGIRSEYVVSSIKDSATLVTVSSKENQEKINKFRNGELDVLVNVNILTEGTDLPNVQTVFLTRPTKSTILMTQMIGRALRGEKAGGTKQAYIVSFIDDWQDKISWVNPEQLYIDENVDFNNKDRDTQKKAMRLVAISKIEEFARIANGTLDERLENIAFVERIPIGIFKFSYLIDDSGDDEMDKQCNLLVYDCMKNAYDKFFDWLPTADLTQEIRVAEHIEQALFSIRDILLGYNQQDILDIIRYYKQTEEVPKLILLSDRKDYDITAIAEQIINRQDGKNKKTIIKEEWERSDKHWSAFFGIENQKVFRKLIDDAIDRIEYPDDYEKTEIKPITKNEQVQIKELSLYEIRNRFPELGEKLRDSIFSKYTDSEGFYFSAESGYKSKNRLDFQIDHIIPMSEGGVTAPDNLQLLTRTENMRKSAKI